ncbi:hypothetical protein OIU79_026990, partial [Salix purpurea]
MPCKQWPLQNKGRTTNIIRRWRCL